MRPLPRLFAFTDRTVRTGNRTGHAAAQIAELGPAVALVARDPSATAAELTDCAAAFHVHARACEASLIVSSRPDIAAAVGAQGVNLRADDLSPRDARVLLPDGWIGRSVHSAVEAAQARDEGADYLVVGPIYHTNTHPDAAPAGIGLIEAVVSLKLPVIAIGGITADRAAAVRDAGAWGVAAISAIWSAHRPGLAAAALLEPWSS
jgi:thiamine-phosphate pyrophosphorylase